MLHPSSTNHLQRSIFQDLLQLILLLLLDLGVVPIFLEKDHFAPGELARVEGIGRIGLVVELANDVVQDVPDFLVIVLIDRQYPARVEVGMRNQENVDWFRIWIAGVEIGIAMILTQAVLVDADAVCCFGI